ncbi:TIGR03087 family PEP-CTERM/XrtA system glycosyltransferase [Parasphingorhabdus sp.]|uniref:TIGR03087 family PEP-CTERM/XrtA system glycosyltransferase n=1 Tax=Parasphingorhabdus sp. TaxID=2709688 RepID=UPI003264B92C
MSEILFLAHRVPWPPDRGDKIRSHHILRHLSRMAPVHLACFADDAAEAEELHEVRGKLASRAIVIREKPVWMAGIEALVRGLPVSLTSFASDQIQAFVDKTVRDRNISCIFVFSGQMAQYIPASFAGRVVMDFVDVDSAKFENYAASGSGPMKWIHHREGRLLRKFEHDVAMDADFSLFVSDAEAELFRNRLGQKPENIRSLGNGIDFAYYDPEAVHAVERNADTPMLLFTGQMDYLPNVEAVRSFSNDAMPIIRKTHPHAEFVIVGRAPTAEVMKLDGRNGTKIVGRVDDIRQWLAAADVVVAPLRIARGIQNKVLEAMAMNKPVVASSAAAQGIQASHDEHFIVAETVQDEARAVADLLNDSVRADTLGGAAGKLMRTRYRWTDQLESLEEYCGLTRITMSEAAE